MSKASILRELFEFIGENKLYWMAPVVIVLALLGLIIIVSSQSAIFGFLYAF